MLFRSELRDDYFGHYTRVVWLAQRADDDDLRALAEDAAGRLGLPLVVLPTGESGLADALSQLVTV